MNKAAPEHYPIRHFPVHNNNLVVGGVELPRLAQRAGQTPFYVYDRQLMTRRVAELRRQMPRELKIHYAMKANPMPAVVQHFATLVDGFDVASAGEMKVALDSGMSPDVVSIAGPGKTRRELRQAIAAGVTIHVESPNELEAIAQLSEQIGIAGRIALRINPAFELKASGMKMGGGAKQFGIDEELLPQVLKRLHALALEFIGFHIYSGSQNLKADAIIEAQQKSLELAIKLSGHCPVPISKLNIGGGFGIPYFPGDAPLDIRQVGDALEKNLAGAKSALPNAEIIVELGRYLVGEAGVYVTRITDKKVSRGQIFLITDGGLNHHLAASGNFGQVIRKNYPVAIGNRMHQDALETVSIVGPLCTPLDILADKVALPKAEPGDFVVIFQSGAYGYTASPRDFLTQPQALELMI
jgi:diaminopimelate decarboxylase